MRLRKKLPNDEKTREFLSSLPRVYLIATWAKTGVWEFPFAGEYQFDKYAQCDVPMVYQYDDFNGTEDNYWLRKITYTTTGFIIGWSFDKEEAQRMADEENARSKL
jgi:hypothetical protein